MWKLSHQQLEHTQILIKFFNGLGRSAIKYVCTLFWSSCPNPLSLATKRKLTKFFCWCKKSRYIGKDKCNHTWFKFHKSPRLKRGPLTPTVRLVCCTCTMALGSEPNVLLDVGTTLRMNSYKFHRWVPSWSATLQVAISDPQNLLLQVLKGKFSPQNQNTKLTLCSDINFEQWGFDIHFISITMRLRNMLFFTAFSSFSKEQHTTEKR